MEVALQLIWKELVWRIGFGILLAIARWNSFSAASRYSGVSHFTSTASTFNVLSFDAKGDGITDDTKAFEAAWVQACQAAPYSTLIVPYGYNFLLGQIIFSGPCRGSITFQVDGTIVAPSAKLLGLADKLLEWMDFSKLDNFILQGTPSSGVIEGNGEGWWYPSNRHTKSSSNGDYSKGRSLHSSSIPTAVRFYGSTNVIVRDLTIINSPQTHLKFDSCSDVLVSNIYIASPGSSPNTDGIHLQNSVNVLIQKSVLKTGDDCVSIQTGTANVMISDLVCGPGHGISIGGLGSGGTKACVSNITVSDSFIFNSQNGVRIKTWQGGAGSVNKVSFTNISVANVTNPIIIDQYYCNKRSCPNKTSAVAITDVSYRSIRGTYYATSAINFACSTSQPCTDIVVDDIELLTYSPGRGVAPVFCWSSYGQIIAESIPKVECLLPGDPRTDQVQRGYSSDTC